MRKAAIKSTAALEKIILSFQINQGYYFVIGQDLTLEFLRH